MALSVRGASRAAKRRPIPLDVESELN